MMRIPTMTQFIHQASAISTQYDKMSRLQLQASSGKKLIDSSDDPVLASQIKLTEDFISKLQGYSNNSALAVGRSQLFSNTVQSSLGAISDAQSVIQQAQNGTLNDNDRANLAKRLQGDLANIFSLANTRDVNGEYIYSGFNTSTPPYALIGSSYQYQGGLRQSLIDIGQSVSALFDEVGFNVFGNIPLGNGTFTVTADPGNTGTAYTSAGSVSPSFVSDTYTITFSTNGSNQLVYDITGAASGTVVTGQVFPSGKNADLSFNGVSLTISGQPQAGDTFQIAPSDTQNIFDTMQSAINVLQSPASNIGIFKQTLSQVGASLDQAFNHFVTYQSDTGTRSAALNAQLTTNKELIDNQKIVLGNIGDAHMDEVLSSLSQQSLALQLTQASYLKMQEILSSLLKM